MLISEYLLQPEKLACDLVAFVDKEGIADKGNEEWTKTVMAGLRKIASGTDIEALFTDPTNKVSEFMLDFVAWSRDGREGIVLAVESEWGWRQNSASYSDAVATDFWKILCAKSPLKLMIFASNATAYPQGPILEKLQQAFESYRHHIPRERYVFIDFAPGAARKAFYVEVPANVGDSVPFVQVPINLKSA